MGNSWKPGSTVGYTMAFRRELRSLEQLNSTLELGFSLYSWLTQEFGFHLINKTLKLSLEDKGMVNLSAFFCVWKGLCSLMTMTNRDLLLVAYPFPPSSLLPWPTQQMII